MTTVDALIAWLAAAGLGTAGTTLFGSLSVAIPNGAGPVTHLIEYGGATPDETQTDDGTAIDRPRVQVTVHATSYSAADTQAQACHRALARVVNRTAADGMRYLRVAPIQAPFELGLDANGRAVVAFNLECWKSVG